MQVGDLVRYRSDYNSKFLPGGAALGLVILIDNNHRQSYARVLFPEGLISRIWLNYLEVVED